MVLHDSEQRKFIFWVIIVQSFMCIFLQSIVYQSTFGDLACANYAFNVKLLFCFQHAWEQKEGLWSHDMSLKLVITSMVCSTVLPRM